MINQLQNHILEKVTLALIYNILQMFLFGTLGCVLVFDELWYMSFLLENVSRFSCWYSNGLSPWMFYFSDDAIYGYITQHPYNGSKESTVVTDDGIVTD